MQTKIEQLESKLAEIRSRISRDAFTQWKSSASTKALLLQFEIDREELKEHWEDGHYNDKELVEALGQAKYIKRLPYVIRALGDFEDEG